jgi:hypothetical protein
MKLSDFFAEYHISVLPWRTIAIISICSLVSCTQSVGTDDGFTLCWCCKGPGGGGEECAEELMGGALEGP